MSEEEQAAQEALEAKAKAKADAEATDEQTPEEKAEAKAKAKADEESEKLKADLKREQEASVAKDKKIADLAFKNREKTRKPDKVEEVADEDKPLTRREYHEMRVSEQKASIGTIVASFTDDETLKELVIEKHRNRTFPSNLSLKEQLEECYNSTASKKIAGERDEALRALKGKEGASNDSAGTHHDAPQGSQPKVEATLAVEMARVGFKYNKKAKRWEKPLDGGKILVRNKDGVTSIV